MCSSPLLGRQSNLVNINVYSTTYPPEVRYFIAVMLLYLDVVISKPDFWLVIFAHHKNQYICGLRNYSVVLLPKSTLLPGGRFYIP